jgi:flagellar biosynthesis protein FlhG
MVSHDPHVKDAIRRQTPILIRSPNSDAANDVRSIAKKVIKELASVNKKARARA